MITKATKLHTTNYSEQIHDEWKKLSNIHEMLNIAIRAKHLLHYSDAISLPIRFLIVTI